MSEHLLDVPGRGAMAEEVHGEGVTEDVRGDALLDPRLPGNEPDALVDVVLCHA